MSVESLLCSVSSQQIQEPLYGTIKPANIWFLLEDRQPHGYEAVADSFTIPEEVKTKLTDFPASRTLLIRQPELLPDSQAKLNFYVIAAHHQSPQIFHLLLDSYDDILLLDFAAIIAGKIVRASDENLFTVCTNGKRDQCCSINGIPLYNQLTKRVGESVWQSSHIGGHRFAATMLCFPHAISYGYLSYDDAEEVVQSYGRGEMLLNKYRGRAIYPKPVQAADYFLRSELGVEAIDALKFLEMTAIEEHWQVLFEDEAGNVHEVRVQEQESDFEVLKSCRDAGPDKVPIFTRITVQELAD